MTALRITAILAAMTGLVPLPTAAQAPVSTPKQEAEGAIARGRLAAAEAAYDRWLAEDLANIEARLGRGNVRAWRHRFVEAREDFEAVLRLDPDQVAARTGLGYTAAWSGDYPGAEQYFGDVLAYDPDNADARKGLALTALWSGRAALAAERFRVYLEDRPGDVDGLIGLGQALMAMGRPGEAERVLAGTIEDLGPRADVQMLRRTARRMGGSVEFSLYGGVTSFDAGGAPPTSNRVFGVRLAELAAQVSPGVRLFVRFDNGLSLDNRQLAANEANLPTYQAGGVFTWGERWITRLDAGVREPQGGFRQRTIGMEQVIVFAPLAARAGLTLITRPGVRADRLVHLGMQVTLVSGTTLSGTTFLNRSVADGNGHRLVGTIGQQVLPGLELAGGFATGRDGGPSGGNVREGFGRVTVDLGRGNRLHLSLRRQQVTGGDDFTILAFGFTAGLLRR